MDKVHVQVAPGESDRHWSATPHYQEAGRAL